MVQSDIGKKKETFVIYPVKIKGISSFAIVPIDNISLYFDIKGAWRIKQSGSSHTNLSNHDKYRNLAEEHLESICINVVGTDLDIIDYDYKFLFDLEKSLGKNSQMIDILVTKVILAWILIVMIQIDVI